MRRDPHTGKITGGSLGEVLAECDRLHVETKRLEKEIERLSRFERIVVQDHPVVHLEIKRKTESLDRQQEREFERLKRVHGLA